MPVSRSGKHRKSKKGTDGHPSASASAQLQEQPLERCAINRHWRDAHMASIVIVRKTTGGFTAVWFQVDTWGLGLKDAFMRNGLSSIALDQLLTFTAGADELIDCPLPLAQELVYGGLAWARQRGFRIPAAAMRCLEILPEPAVEPDLSRFGIKDETPVSLAAIKKWFSRR